MSWESLGENVLGGGIWAAIATLSVFLGTKARNKYLQSHKDNQEALAFITKFCEELENNRLYLTAEEVSTSVRVLKDINAAVYDKDKKRDGDIKFAFILIFICVLGTTINPGHLYYFYYASISLIVVYVIYVIYAYSLSPTARAGVIASKKISQAIVSLNVVDYHRINSNCKSMTDKRNKDIPLMPPNTEAQP